MQKESIGIELRSKIERTKERKDKMYRPSQKGEGKKKMTEVKTFPVIFALGENKKNITINTNTPSKSSKEQIINLAIKFHSQDNIQEAAKYYQLFINQGFEDHRVFSNYGIILKDLGKLQEAELFQRKAIKIKPDFAEAHFNLGGIMFDLCNLQEAIFLYRKAIELKPDYVDAHYNLGIILSILGKLQDAETFTLKAIQLNPDYALGYYSLSLLKYSDKNMRWRNQLFSENILSHQSQKDKVNIYFARANVLHKEKNYKESSKYIKLANKLKYILKSSNAENLINQSKALKIESNKQEINQKQYEEIPESIFIVGMPRSGSTLVETIISMNPLIDALGETKILKESFQDYKENNQILTLAERYWSKIKEHKQQSKIITTNKNLYNYQFAGIIAKRIPNAKIIHCYRNPLDNILSIYRTHFKSNQYSSSLIDITKVYLDQEEIMNKYKNRFRSKIYDLDYDLLVSNPHKEIKSLISWLGWEWEDKYLSPHLNPRSVSTASNVQIRSPINSKSIGGWKNYKNMLKPAIEILTQTIKYKNIIS